MTVEKAQAFFPSAQVIAVKPARGSGFVILCRFKGEYVTWRWEGANKDYGGYAGHYYRDSEFAEAVEDFKARK